MDVIVKKTTYQDQEYQSLLQDTFDCPPRGLFDSYFLLLDKK